MKDPIIKQFYVDGHVHIGRANDGSPVKMAASPSLTFENLLREASKTKGIHILGVIDAAAIPVVEDIKDMCSEEKLITLSGGGLSVPGEEFMVMLGAEVEINGKAGGSAHFGLFVGTLDALMELSQWLKKRQTNATLSSQKTRATAQELGQLAKDLNGILIVNHAFTPHKGLYGNCVDHLADMIPPELVSGIELGLSADTEMADHVSELRDFSFVTNSDAHSLPKIAREYHVVELSSLNFSAYKEALVRPELRKIKANVGLWPKLGKYHLSHCPRCNHRFDTAENYCPSCKNAQIVQGVQNRLMQIADLPVSISPDFRPPYHYHIPLEWIPGLGPKKRMLLFQAFGTEMQILNHASMEDLQDVVGADLAQAIIRARRGQWEIIPGAGGVYGSLKMS